MQIDPLYQALAAFLGDPRRPAPTRPATWDRWCALARSQGVMTLLLARRPRHGKGGSEALRAAAVRDLLQTEEDRRVLSALGDAGLRPLVLKGAALAHWLYPEPWLRPREDTDLLLPADEYDRAGRVLEGLGYRRLPVVDGALVMGQALYHRPDARGGGFVVDLHRRVCNLQAFARRLDHRVLAPRARPLPALGPAARGLAPADALLHACLHLLAHHRDQRRLIWLYDIHLLAAGLDDEGATELARRAREEGLVAVTGRCLREVRDLLHTPLHPRLGALLEAADRRDEPGVRWLDHGGGMRGAWIEFQAAGPWSRRLRWLGQALFPSPAYMRARHPGAPALLLPWLYLRRAARGAARYWRG